MVIRDSDSPFRKENRVTPSVSTAPFMASPVDRFASVVIDYLICLMPLIYLVLAPFQRAMKEATLFENDWKMSLAMFLGAVAVLILVLFYQTIFVGLWGATLGQWLMGLRVQTLLPHGRVTYTQALTRSVYWLLSCVLLGVPFLAVFSHHLRRPLHDRVSDTMVVSGRAERAVISPSRHESSLVQGIFWAMTCMMVLLVGQSFVSTVANWQQQNDVIRQLEDEEVLCAAVGNAQSEWSEAENQDVERLDVAMALYAAGSIDQKCLEGEVENLFMSYAETPTLYLAKAFVYADHPELSDMYLAKVCEMNAEGDDCRLSRVVQAISEDNWPQARKEIEQLSGKPPVYAAIWSARQLLAHDEFYGLERYLQALPDILALADFTAPARTKWLWGINKKEEALGAEAVAYASLNDWSKLELSSFMCFEQLWADCGQIQSRACQQFGKLADTRDDALSTLAVSMTYLRRWECENPQHKKYEALMSKGLHDDAKALIVALDNQGTDGFSELLEDPTQGPDFKSEITRRLVERTQSRGLLKLISEEWMSEPNTLGWQKVGKVLFKRLYDYEEYALSMRVAEKLTPANARPTREDLQSMIMAAFKSGQRERAREFLTQYSESYPIVLGERRAPASQWAATLSEEFQKIIQELGQRGGL